MGDNIVFPTMEIRKEFRYRADFEDREKDGKPFRYPVIVLYKKSTKLPVFFTGLERYIIEDCLRSGWTDSTLRKKAFCVVKFLNWVLHETMVPGLDSLTMDDMREFLQYESKEKKASADYWVDLRESVARFLANMIDGIKDVRFRIRKEDLIQERTLNMKTGRGYVRTKTINEYNSFGVKAPRRLQGKNRYLPYEWLEILLDIMEKVHPELVLAVELQAYGGLREGEVVNVAFETFLISGLSLGSRTVIEINLEHEAGFWKNYKGKTHPGEIKKRRKQRIYPDFVEKVKKQYSDHLDLMKERKLPIHGDNPLFVNSRGKPLTVQRYSQIIREVFEKHFIPHIESDRHEPEYLAILDLYEKEYPGAHMFRHWFTMYLLTKAKNGGQELTPSEIMKWRGDSSITSMNDYIHLNYEIIEEFRKSTSRFQQKTILEHCHPDEGGPDGE